MKFTYNKMHMFYVYSLISFDNPLEEEMATHSSILALEILWTEEPDQLRKHFILDYKKFSIFSLKKLKFYS